MLPPWEAIDVVKPAQSIQNGTRVTIRVPVLGPFKKTWVAEHYGYDEGVQFCDRQITGPFKSLEHTHRFDSIGADRSRLTDHIEYQPPGGFLGRLALGLIRGKLERGFKYRHQILVDDLTRHAPWQDRPRLKVAIAGSSGLIGSELIPMLLTGGHQVVRLLRKQPDRPLMDGTSSIVWNPARGELNSADLEGIDAIVNLAGEGIADKRWTTERKRQIQESRVSTTMLLAQAIATMKQPPRVFFNASAIGYYPTSGDRELTENHPAGQGFLPEVCQAWEAATLPAQQAGVRTVLGRIGIVLSARGGTLKALLPLFRFCLAGRIGTGRQFMPWIEIGDLIGSIYHCLMDSEMSGPVNLVAPHVVTNAEFTSTLAKTLSRFAILPAPAVAMRLALGEMADALVLASLRVVPQRLQQSSFQYRYPQLEPALRHQLGR